MKFDIEKGILIKYHEDPMCPDIVIPDNVTEVAEGAFFGKGSSIHRLKIPSSVKSVGNTAFGSCINLKSVEIEEGLENIGLYAFQCCIHLDEIILPRTVKKIEGYTFIYCGYLKSVTLYDGIEEIGEGIFEHCMSLNQLNMIINDYKISFHISICKTDGKLKEDSQRVIDFLVSDDLQREKIFKSIKKPEFKIPVAMYLLFVESNGVAADYIRKTLKNVVKYIAEYRETDCLKKIAGYDFFTKRNIDECIGIVQEKGNSEMLDILLEYRKERLGMGEITQITGD